MTKPLSEIAAPSALPAALHVGSDLRVDGDGAVHLGTDVILGSRVKMHTQRDRDVRIGSRVWIGDDVEVLPGVLIGDYAIICAGARVEADVAEYALMVGNPASQMWRLR